MKKKIVIITTEPSGDLLGSRLIKALNQKKDYIEFYGVGGDMMKSVGFKSFLSMQKLSVNGIFEVMSKLGMFIKSLYRLKNFIKKLNPDILITIDSPSFSIRLVKMLQSLRFKTKFIHYVAPTVWAWKSYRAKKFAKNYDLILTLFKFESSFFPKGFAKVKHVGHPVFYNSSTLNITKKNEKIITIFPGSRKNEIKRILPILLKVINFLSNKYKNLEFKIITLPSLEKFVKSIVKDDNFEIISDLKLREKMIKKSIFSIATSGTVSMELAFNKIPMIVVYDCNYLTSILLKFFVKLKWCSIVNIINDKEIIPELLFSNFNFKSTVNKFEEIFFDRKKMDFQVDNFIKLKNDLLVDKNNPSNLAATEIMELVN